MSSTIAKRALNTLHDITNQVVLLAVTKHLSPRAVYLLHRIRKMLTMAVLPLTCVIAARFYWKVIRVPPYLRGLPRVPFLFSLKSIITQASVIEAMDAEYQMVRQNAVRRGLTSSDKDEIPMWIQWRFGQWNVIIANPTDTKEFLIKSQVFEKVDLDSVPMYAVHKFMGGTQGFERTPKWKQLVKVTGPAFRRSWPTSLFAEPTTRLLAQLDILSTNQKPVNIPVWMGRVTLDALSLIMYGNNIDSVHHPNSHFMNAYERLRESLFDPLLNLLGSNLMKYSRANRQFNKDLEVLNKLADTLIDKVATQIKAQGDSIPLDGDGFPNLLETMVNSHLKNPTLYTREELRRACNGTYFAGHDTTATTLSMAIYLLGMNHHYQDIARKEVIDIMGDVDSGIAAEDFPIATNKQLNEMQYLTNVIKETLRLYPVAPQLSRQLTSDHIFASSGLQVPKSTLVTAYTHQLHHSQDYWGADAHEFRPQRWEDLNNGNGPIPMEPGSHDYTWTPFGGGQRICPGQQFSLVEQRVILSAMLLRYTWHVVGNNAALSGYPQATSSVVLNFKDIFVELLPRNL